MNCVDDCKYREMLDDANADLQELKAENAKLKNNNNYLHEMLSEARQANEYLHAELKRHKSILRTRPNAMTALYDENAKLRELVRGLNWCIESPDGPRVDCELCPLGVVDGEPLELMCEKMMRELGVEAPDV